MTTTENHQGQLYPLSQSTNSLSSESVLSWIQELPDPDTEAYTPRLEGPITKRTKRCRSIDSTPSVFLGKSEAGQKKQKLGYGRTSDAEEAIEVEGSDDINDNSFSRMLTPSHAPSSSESTITRDPPNSNTQTPKKQKTNTGQNALGYKMSMHGLQFEHDAFAEAVDFKDHITDLILSDRSSEMKPQSVRRFNACQKKYSESNEYTYLFHMVPTVLGHGYHPEPDEEQLHLDEAEKWREFLGEEGVHITLNQDFTRTLLPSKFSEVPGLIDEIAHALEKDKGMTNPRPDFTFGLDRDKYPLQPLAPIPQGIFELLEIAPGMHHPFLIIEGKSPAGNDIEAQNQARRGGATLVKALRKLRADITSDLALPPSPPSSAAGPVQIAQKPGPNRKRNPVQPDRSSFVFAITLSPTYFTIWVHWYDEANSQYHMNSVESWSLRRSKGPGVIRWALHNIIEWGVRTRRPQIEALIKNTEARVTRNVQKMQDELLASREAKAASKTSSRAAKGKKRARDEEGNGDD